MEYTEETTNWNPDIFLREIKLISNPLILQRMQQNLQSDAGVQSGSRKEAAQLVDDRLQMLSQGDSDSVMSKLSRFANNSWDSVKSSFDPGPAPDELGMEGSYRNPISTAIGGRVNPILAAGLTALSAGQAMQGQPLTAVDLLKTGVAREGQLADLRAKRSDVALKAQAARLSAIKEQRESNIQNVKDYNEFLTKMEDARSAGLDESDPAFMELYNQGKKKYLAQGGDAEGWAHTFKAARQYTQRQREVLEVFMGEGARLLPPSELKNAAATMMKDPKALQNASLAAMLKLNEIAVNNGSKPIYSAEQILERQATSEGKTREEKGVELKTKEYESRIKGAEADVADATYPARVEGVKAESKEKVLKVRKTSEDIKHTVAQTQKLIQEVASHSAEPEIQKALKEGLTSMSSGTPLAKLPEVQRMAVTKAMTDQDLRSTMLEIQLFNAKIHGEAVFGEMFKTAYTLFVNAEQNGSAEDKKLAITMMRRLGIKATTEKSMVEEFLNMSPSKLTVPEPSAAKAQEKPPSGRAKTDDDVKILEDLKKRFPPKE